MLGALSACNKKSDNPPATIAGGTMSATIDGVAWAAQNTTLNRSPATILQFIGERNPSGTLASGIGVEILAFNGINTYPIDTQTTNAYLVWNDKLATAKSGTISVSEDSDAYLRVSFQFAAADSFGDVKAVQGSFTYKKK